MPSASPPLVQVADTFTWFSTMPAFESGATFRSTGTVLVECGAIEPTLAKVMVLLTFTPPGALARFRRTPPGATSSTTFTGLSVQSNGLVMLTR